MSASFYETCMRATACNELNLENGLRALLSTVMDANQILVLDGGRIVEPGPHCGLLEINGVYAEMCPGSWCACQAATSNKCIACSTAAYPGRGDFVC